MNNTSIGSNSVGQTPSDKCYICLSPFENQAVGSLENCPHVFCLECILQWSQTANTCPVDRISFAFIHQRVCPGGEFQTKIKVRTQKKDDEDEEEGNSIICEGCGRSDRTHRLLVCIHCDSGYHMDCLRPPLNSGSSEGDWICPDCVVSPHNTEGFREEEEISDGELTDLLAEVDQTASTSSRLRPSTVNHPSIYTQRRQSSRIQSRGGSSPHPRLQTCWHVPKYLLRASRPAVTTEGSTNQSNASNTSIKLKTRKRRKRAA